MVEIDEAELKNLRVQGAALERIVKMTQLIQGEMRPAIDALAQCHSQIGQDLFVIGERGWKRNGTFVEFGATDGKSLNNTWMLEKAFGWKGILAEPARCWHDKLKASGRTATIVTDCIWSESGKTLKFRETGYAELSTLVEFSNTDSYDRSDSIEYDVQTISLNDLLQKHGAPREMDYLSIDTEGSEFEILQALDFDRFRFHVITCEHNFTPKREAVLELLTAKGYVRKMTELSAYDDWYVYKG